MPSRTVVIQNPASIRSCHNSLLIETSAGAAKIPLEDIWVLILESREISLTSCVLSEMAEAGIGVMICGKNHMPSGLSLPLGAHSRHAAIVENQLSMSKPLKKQLWQSIVRKKIENQARVLELLGIEGSTELRKISKNVLSDDSSGREAVAASLYFKAILPRGGRRGSLASSSLDYGYAILRAGIARCAVSGGWLVSRGIHHCSNLNAFNLVDDLIEPFRPAVDLIVMEKTDRLGLDANSKKALASLFEYQVEVDGRVFTIQSAIENMLDSFKRSVISGDASLLELPSIVSLRAWDGGDR